MPSMRQQGLYPKYAPLQKEIIDQINKETGIGIQPSDSWLLGHITREGETKLSQELKKIVEEYKRERGYRFCLTPYFEEEEKAS